MFLNFHFSGASGFIDMKKHMVSNLSTVAVVPITTNAPLSHFTRELCAAVKAIGEWKVFVSYKTMVNLRLDDCNVVQCSIIMMLFVCSSSLETNKWFCSEGARQYSTRKVDVTTLCIVCILCLYSVSCLQCA